MSHPWIVRSLSAVRGWSAVRRGFWIVAALVSVVNQAAAESLTAKLPAGAFASTELTHAGVLIERFRESDLKAAIVDSAEYQTWSRSNDGRKFRGGRAVLEGQLGLNLWDAAVRILGDRAVLGLYPPAGDGQPDGVLLVHLADQEIGPHLREKLTPLIGLADGALIEQADGERWLVESRDGKLFASLHGRWLVFASTRDLRAATHKLLDGEATEALASQAAWRSRPVADVPADTTTLSTVFDVQPVREKLGRERILPAKVDNPLGSLLLGGLLEVVALTHAIHGDLSIRPDGYQLKVHTPVGRAAVDGPHQTMLATQPATGLTPQVPRQLAGFTLCREWAEWYRRRDDLLEAKVLPEYDKFETGLSTFMPGKDFAEDVLALLNTPLSIVAAEQTYPHLDGRPGMQLPAFAVILDFNDPQRGADIFQLFFQTLGTITNIEAGKDGRQPWVMSSESHAGVQLTFAKYLDKPKGDELPAIFNYQPAAALVGRKFIAATSLELCRDLVDNLQQPAAARAESAARNFEFTLDPVIGGVLLEANRALVTAQGVQSGKTLEQAAGELERLVELLRRLTPVTLTTDVTDDGVELTLEGGWK